MCYSGEGLKDQNDDRNMQDSDYDPDAFCRCEVSIENGIKDHEHKLCHVYILRFWGRLRLKMAD